MLNNIYNRYDRYRQERVASRDSPQGKFINGRDSPTQKTLYKVSSLFPLDLFPDCLVIDINKVSIIRKYLFGIEHIHSILIEDITDVSLDIGLLFAVLSVTDSSNYRFPTVYTIKNLRKKDAKSARDIMQGLVAARRHNIVISKGSDKKFIDFVQCLGDYN